MKIKIPDKCKKCQFLCHDVYDFYKCTIYKKLRRRHALDKKPRWCRVKEVTVKED